MKKSVGGLGASPTPKKGSQLRGSTNLKNSNAPVGDEGEGKNPQSWGWPNFRKSNKYAK
jgi:hypothetical protein